MRRDPQLDLFAAISKPSSLEVEWFVGVLRGRGWVTAEELLRERGLLTVTEQHKRRLRALAEASEGQVGSGDGGYKLILEMTADEFGKFDRRLANQEAGMMRRRVASQRVFYRGTNVGQVAEVAG